MDQQQRGHGAGPLERLDRRLGQLGPWIKRHLRPVSAPALRLLEGASRRTRIAVVLLACALYAFLFIPLYPYFGPALGAFGFVPTILAASALGERAGVVFGLGFVPLHLVLYAEVGRGDDRGTIPAALLIAFVGMVVGRLRDLGIEHAHQRRELEDSLAAEHAARARRVAAELELRQAQKLESVGRLAAGVAHEINTPVQFVSDSVHFVRDAAAELILLLERYRRHPGGIALDDDEREEIDYLVAQVPKALDRSLDGIARVAAIVRSLKQFAHPDQSEMSQVDLNEAIRSTLTVARNEYKYVADLEIDLGELPPVTCQVGEINQAFLNLVVNAAHAIGDAVAGTERRGTITVRTRTVGDHSVDISVSDTGPGIPEAIRDRIFEPFFTTKEVGRGTGQGLAIARRVVREKHGGDLTFSTEAGRGTTFTIRLRIDGNSGGQEARAA